ncbi:MAG: M24 family metallopeptidase [Gemmatimonadota bacterium]|nr:M24 family metallopeptidase [Gemmatimonadota bacterium]
MSRLATAAVTVFLLAVTFAAGHGEISPKVGRDLVPQYQLESMQGFMMERRFDGWMFSGQGAFGDIETEFLGLTGSTRWRWFIYYSGVAGAKKPYLIYHRDDEAVFSGIKFYPLPYRSRNEMFQIIHDRIYAIARLICLNYSHQLNVPEISSADAGLLEKLASMDFKVISSGSILSFFNTRWRSSDVETHKQAAAKLDSLRPLVCAHLRQRIQKGKEVTDYDLMKFIGRQLKKLGLGQVALSCVGVGDNTLIERYVPVKRSAARSIERDDLVYIEVSARLRKQPRSMRARLGWTFYIGEEVPEELQGQWKNIVAAADAALEILEGYIPRKLVLQGYRVDQAARARLGGQAHTPPRPLGFNLNPENHRFGVRFDDYMAHDDREIIPGMGFTLEPGLYYEGLHALRMCNNVLIQGDRSIFLSAPLQREIDAVLAP